MNVGLVKALQAAVEFRYDDSRTRAEAATLEAAIELLEQLPIACDFAMVGVLPKQWLDRHPPSDCRGAVFQRVCADCGHTITRCDVHGGTNATGRAAYLHRVREHTTTTKGIKHAATEGKRR